MRSASNPHAFMGVTENGLAAIVKTRGNQDVHVILRGGSRGPNYAAEYVRDCGEKMIKAGFAPKVMIDCSHGNTQKLHRRQLDVAEDIVSRAWCTFANAC